MNVKDIFHASKLLNIHIFSIFLLILVINDVYIPSIISSNKYINENHDLCLKLTLNSY